MKKLFLTIRSISIVILLLCVNCSERGDVVAADQDATQSFQVDGDTKAEWRNASRVLSVDFTDPEGAWIITRRTYSIFRTRDGGKTWFEVDVASKALGILYSLDFLDSRTGFIVNARSEVFETKDEGKTWQPLASLGTFFDGKPLRGARHVRFVDSSRGWVFGVEDGLRTLDGGRTWHHVPDLPVDPERVVVDPDGVFIIGTGDGDRKFWFGKLGPNDVRWSAAKVDDDCLAEAIEVINSKEIWASCSPRKLFRSVDGGKEWAKVNAPDMFNVTSMHWASAKEGLLAGFQCAEPQCIPMNGKAALFSTSNGGTRWDRVPFSGTDPFLSKIYFSDSSNGWLLARDHVYRTTSGGRDWVKVFDIPF